MVLVPLFEVLFVVTMDHAIIFVMLWICLVVWGIYEIGHMVSSIIQTCQGSRSPFGLRGCTKVWQLSQHRTSATMIMSVVLFTVKYFNQFPGKNAGKKRFQVKIISNNIIIKLFIRKYRINNKSLVIRQITGEQLQNVQLIQILHGFHSNFNS